MEILNETPFPVGMLAGRLHFPGHSLTIVVKGTFDLVPGGTVEASEEQLPPTGDEEHDSENDAAASLRYASDLVHYKPAADLLLAGQAHAPGGEPLRRLRVTFGVGDREKVLQVTGDRWWSGESIRPQATDPHPFTAMDLTYENAFGGEGFDANPAGKGYTRVPSDAGYEVLPLPNVEAPGATMDRADAVVSPAGFGPLHPQWEPRASKVGSYGGSWVDERWPWFPEDFDWSYFNAAPPDMRVEGFLQGDEELLLEHLDPERPRIQTSLPGLRTRCFVRDDAEGFREVPLRLDTLWVDAEAGTAVLVWRGHTEVATEAFEEVTHLYVLSEPLAERPRPLEEVRARFDRAVADTELEEEMEGPPEAEGEAAADDATDPDEEVGSALQELNASLSAAGLEPADPEAPPPEQSPEARERSEEMLAAYGIDDLDEEAPGNALTRADVEELLRRGESLSGRDASGADLSELDLAGADLSEAVLDAVNLRGAALDGANLGGATLEGADLTGASLRDCDMTEADLGGARLVDAELIGATLDDAVLEGADLRNAVLEEAEGADAIFTGADLGRVRAAGSALPGADFTDATMQECDFREADLEAACIEGADAAGADFTRARLVGFQAGEGADLTRASIVEAEAADSIWSGSRLVEANLRYADLEGVAFSEADLTRADLSATEMTEGRLEKAVLAGARMIRCNLFEAILEKANLEDADLRGSNLYGAEVLDARLDGTRLDGANVKMTKLAPS